MTAGLSERARSRLVGRARELAALDAALDGALGGRGGLVLLTGEPGIGKTALAREFVEHAALRGAAWAWGSCWDGGGAPAYWPWVQVGRALARRAERSALRDALGGGAAWIAGLLPELGDALGAPAQLSELDSDQARFRLFDALATLLATVAQERPLVIVLDDLHWADVSSLLALEFVARSLPDVPLLAIAAHRHAEAHARPELGTALGGLARVATRLPLEGLARDEVGLLAAARAHGLGAAESEPIPPRLVTAVHEASAGNPFFADELVQLLAAQGRLHDGAAAERPLPLPDGVRDAIRRRLAPLDAAVVRALSAAAVLGREFTLHTLASVLGEPPPAVLGTLDVPLRTGLLTNGGDSGRFAFAHALVRDTLVEQLGTVRRAELHRAVGEALELAYRDDLEPHLAEIAHHFVHAASEGAAERAVDYAARAALRAAGQFAHDEAARLYEQALDVAASMPSDDERAWQLTQGLGEARMRGGAIEDARRALRSAAEHARRLDDPERLAQTALAGALGAFSPGPVEPELVASLEEALGRVDALAPQDPVRRATVDSLRCRVRVQLALALYWSPQRERREQLVGEALTLARALGDERSTAQRSPAQRVLAERTLAFALAQGFVAVWGPDTVDRGLAISREAAELCERTNDAELGMQVRLWRISLLLELDDPVRADEEIEAFGTIARRLGQPRMLVYDPLHRAMAAQLRGDLVTAEALTADALEQSSGVPGSIAPMIADAQMCIVRRLQGRQDDIEPYVRKHADRLPEIRRWRCGLALVLAELGRVDEARRELGHLAAADFEDVPRDSLWLVAMSLLAELCALLDDRRRARRLYALLVGYDGRNVVSMGVYVGPVARYLGLLAMTIGENERALAHLAAARRAGERMGTRASVVLTALDAAEVLVRRDAPGDAQQARTLVQRAARDAAEMQLAAPIARAEQLLERLDEAARPARKAAGARPLHAALRREQDVWLLDYEGRSVWLRDAKGLHHLAALFERPGTAIASLALAGAVPAAQRATLVAGRPPALELRPAGDGGADGERARVNVTRAIKAAVVRIGEHEPELAHLLRGTVRTGTSCAYQPDPAMPLQWEVRR